MCSTAVTFFRSGILGNSQSGRAIFRSSSSWRYGPLIRTAHVSITILSRFCCQIQLKTSYNWVHLVEVSKMNACFDIRSVTDVFKNTFFIARVTLKSNDKRYRVRSVSVVNQNWNTELKISEKKLFTGLGRSVSRKTFPSVLNARDLRDPVIGQSFPRYGPPGR